MKIRLIEQHDIKDCGAACLAMISDSYGISTSISRCRKLTHTGRRGSSMFSFEQAAPKLGMNCEILQGTVEELLSGLDQKEYSLPFIAHMVIDNLTHFVVIHKITSQYIFTADPGRGYVKYTKKEFADKWSGFIAAFTPIGPKMNHKSNDESFFRYLFKLIAEQKKSFIKIVLLSALIILTGITSSLVFMPVIDGIISDSEIVRKNLSDENTKLGMVFGGLLIMYILQFIFGLIRGRELTGIAKETDRTITAPYYKKLLKLSVLTINSRNAGDYISRYNDLSVIRNASSEAALTLILDTSFAIISAFTLCLMNCRLFLVTAVVISLNAIIVLVFRKPVYRINNQIMQSESVVQSVLKETVDGSETIRATASSDYFNKVFCDGFLDLSNKVRKSGIICNNQNVLAELIENAGYALVLWIGFSFVEDNILTLGTLIAFSSMTAYLSQPVKNIVQLQPTLQTAYAAYERMADIMDEESENETASRRGGQVMFTPGDISIRGLTYENNDGTVIDGLDLNIRQGESIAITGRNGCGKSTLARLLAGLYEKTSGDIIIGNTHINNITLSSLRQNIAYISCESYLFSDSVINNIRMGREDIDEETLISICRKCRIDEIVSGLPMSYMTCLEANGHNLSSGQRQRIMIARALAQKARVMILDEITNSMDTETENEILDMLLSLPNLTLIFITHKENVVSKCKKAYVLENGKLIENNPESGKILSMN